MTVLNEARVLEKADDEAGIYCEDGFLDASACQTLIDAFERSRGLTFRTPTGDSFFDNRYLWINSLPESENLARRIMQASRYRIIDALVAFYGERQPFYSDTIQLVKWMEGQSMPPHSDNCHPDGAPHNTPWRKYASVVYLNDDYGGGNLYFKPLNTIIRKRRGRLVIFRGDSSHEHGVTTITSGLRYTMPGWYTDLADHRDHFDREIY